jgi:hypothetical protein
VRSCAHGGLDRTRRFSCWMTTRPLAPGRPAKKAAAFLLRSDHWSRAERRERRLRWRDRGSGRSTGGLQGCGGGSWQPRASSGAGARLHQLAPSPAVGQRSIRRPFTYRKICSTLTPHGAHPREPPSELALESDAVVRTACQGNCDLFRRYDAHEESEVRTSHSRAAANDRVDRHRERQTELVGDSITSNPEEHSNTRTQHSAAASVGGRPPCRQRSGQS